MQHSVPRWLCSIPPDDLVLAAAELFHGLLDYTVPVVSLVKGARITRNIAAHYGDLDVRDLWLPFFCVSTNLTGSRVELHDRGDLATAIRACVAIPGILPPVPSEGISWSMGGAQQPAVRYDARLADDQPADRGRPVTESGTARRGRLRAVAVGLEGPAAHVGSGRVRSRARCHCDAVDGRRLGRDRDRILADGFVDCYLDLELTGVRLLDFDRVAEIADRGTRPPGPASRRGSLRRTPRTDPAMAIHAPGRGWLVACAAAPC